MFEPGDLRKNAEVGPPDYINIKTERLGIDV
jgi:hypothetical protein